MTRASASDHARPARVYLAAPKRFTLLAMVLVIAGCATGPSRFGVTYDSYPQGATLQCGGAVMGYTPTTLYYDIKGLENRVYLVNNCKATWVSGAEYHYESIPWQNFGRGVTVTLQRPEVPGLQQDMEFALQAQQFQAQQRYQQQALRQQALQQMTAPPANGYGSTVVNCAAIGDLSGRIHQFQYSCPPGYFRR